MKKGFYYRCPVIMEEADKKYPRFFVLAQMESYNELSGMVTVKMHDLLGTSSFYGDILQQTQFYARRLKRCAGKVGSVAEGAWGRGTIVSCVKPPPLDEDTPHWYYIRLPSGEYVKKDETEVRLEYSQMDYAPDKQLRACEFQNPTWFLNRLKVSQNQHLVNHAAYGFKILAGCRAFLLPHQVSAIARCLETVPVRYMLADEVGLGKTVEACSVLKILASEKRGFRALLIAPSALIGQWRNELRYKFNLRASVITRAENFRLTFDSPCTEIRILPMERIPALARVLEADWDMAIVDETHRLLERTNALLYHHVRKLSQKTPNLLLLSATPIQDRQDEYHRLLALLNPEQYQNMPKERFNLLVRKQQKIQQRVNQQLKRMNRYADYAEDITDKLREIAEELEDTAFQKLTDGIDLNGKDGGEQRVRQALSYICENYRLERNVIRNRRQTVSETMAKRTLEELPYDPLSADELYNEIGVIQAALSWLSEQSDDGKDFIKERATPLLGALFSSPWALEETLQKLRVSDERLSDLVSVWKRQAELEHEKVNIALDEEPDFIKGRLMKVMDYLDQEWLERKLDCKIVVFTSYHATLKAFLRLFERRYESKGIYAVAFSRDMRPEDLEGSVYAFQNDPYCMAIVCDETGGEGRNFQNAQLVVHLDLPWNANALEQRIGRLDRLGRNPEQDVLSVVPYARGTVEEQLFRIWRDGMSLFGQSLSGLEIITGELNKRISDALREDFYHGLENAFDEILETAESMRESVEDEQLFDIGATLYKPLFQGIEHVLNLYARDGDNRFTQAMTSWSHQTGLTPERPTADGLIEFREGKFSVGAAKQALFPPPDWTFYRHSSIMRRAGKILGSFDRAMAATREDILFFAPGDAVYDTIISNAEGCSRGRCCAMGIRGEFSYDGIVFIYHVEAPLYQLLDAGISPRTLYQYQMFLPLEPIIIPVALTKQSVSVPEMQVIDALLSVPAYKAEHLGRRGARYGEISPLERFFKGTSPERWKEIADKSSGRAYRIACKRMKSLWELDAAKKEMLRVLHGYRSECLYFDRPMEGFEEKKRVFSATWNALKNAKPVLEACCFLRVRTNEQR